MGVAGAEQQCECYKECQEFRKLVELKDTGLVVYCHSVRERSKQYVKQDEVVDTAESRTQRAFILQNTKDVKITPADLLPEIEKNDISCPRCRKIFEQAQELMQNVTSIDRRNVMGICDHCHKKAQSLKKTCYECEEIVKKFISIKNKQKEDTKKYIQIWLSQMRDVVKGPVMSDKSKIKTRAYSDIQIGRLVSTPEYRREPEVEQMFYSDINKSDTDLKIEISDVYLKDGKILEKSVGFTQPFELMETPFAVTPYGGDKKNAVIPLQVESDATLADTLVGVKKPPKTSLKDHRGKENKLHLYYDDSSVDAKEAIKKRHDLSLRQMTRPKVYEIPKVAPWEQQEIILKSDDDSEKVKGRTKTKHEVSSKTRPVKSKSSKTFEKDYISEFYDKPVTDAKGRDKRKHEPTLKHTSSVPDSERELRKHLDSRKPIKFTPSQKDMKEATKRKLDLNSQHMMMETDRENKKSEQYRIEKYGHGKIKKTIESEEIPKKIKKHEDRYLADDEIKLQRDIAKFSHETEKPGQRVVKTKTGTKKVTVPEETAEHILKKQFSYFFPKSMEKEVKTLGARSSQLIKNTQEKLRQQAEEEREKKKLAREEKKRQAEEKKQLLEEQKKYTEEQKYERLHEGKKYDAKHSESKIIRQDKYKEDGLKRDSFRYGDDKSKEDISKKDKRKRDSWPESEKNKNIRESVDGRKDKQDRETERTKRDSKWRPGHKDSIDEGWEGAKKHTSKLEHRDTLDRDSEKPKKDTKRKSDSYDRDYEAATGKIKKGRVKEEPESKDYKMMEEIKRKQKDKSETYYDDELTELVKKGFKSKAGKRDTIDELTEKSRRDSKLRSEQRDKFDVKKEKGKRDSLKPEEKDRKSKSQMKETDKEARKERGEQLQKDKEGQDRFDHTAPSRTQKELGYSKKGSPKQSEKQRGSPKELDLPSKMLESSKDKGGYYKKEDMPKSKQEYGIDEKEDLYRKKQDSRGTDSSKKEKQTKINAPKKEETTKVSQQSKESKEGSSKIKSGSDEAEFRKLQAELVKKKEEDQKKKQQQEGDVQRIRDLADKRAQEENEQKGAPREAKAVIVKPEPKRPLIEKPIKEEKKPPEVKIGDIKVRNASTDDLILRLVQIKQSTPGKAFHAWNIDPSIIKLHRCRHVISGQLSTLCALCFDSELEIDAESYDNKLHLESEIGEIIIGEKICKQKPPNLEKIEEQDVRPMLFQTEFREDLPLPFQPGDTIRQESEPVKKHILPTALSSKKDTKGVEVEPGKGVIRYALSDRTFIDKGWTMLPTEKVVRKMNVYRMRPARPEFDWFEHNKNKRLMNYDTGEKLAEFDDNGRGRLYYRNGRLALDYYDAEEANAQQRFVIYSSGEPDERGRTHPITILATFDYLGNGIVFDHTGKIRLKYNQTEGVVLDRGIGPVSHWKWHTLNDPPVLQQVMIDTQMAHKDPDIIKLGTAADTKNRPDNEEMLAIEFDNFIKEKSKKLSQKFKPFQIKMKALKINENFSLKVLDQATVYLIYRDGSTNLKLNIGMILDHQEIVDTDTAEVGEVSNNVERLPARTDSLAGLQRSIAYAQRYERQHTERERRLRRPHPSASADQLTAAASSPLRPPLKTVPTGSTSSVGCGCRKPTSNLYYNTRLL